MEQQSFGMSGVYVWRPWRAVSCAGCASLISLPDGRRLDLFLEGPPSGTPLLFHHGSPASGLPDPAFVAPLAERDLRYVAWSRPGYGDSTRQSGRAVADVVADAAAVLDHIGADRAYTLGWSGGGPHAMAAAAGLPDRILGATTIGGVAPYPAEGIDWFEGMGPENIEEFGASLESPEALIAYKERAWPIWSVVTGDEIAEALGGLIDDVDRGALTGEFAEALAASYARGVAQRLLGLVRRRHGLQPRMGLRHRLDSRARPYLAGRPRPDGAVRARAVAGRTRRLGLPTPASRARAPVPGGRHPWADPGRDARGRSLGRLPHRAGPPMLTHRPAEPETRVP